jgi:hypothetical protein
MVYIPFADTVTDMLAAQSALQQIACIARGRRDLRLQAAGATAVQQRECVRCGQQLVRFWPAANDAAAPEAA